MAVGIVAMSLYEFERKNLAAVRQARNAKADPQFDLDEAFRILQLLDRLGLSQFGRRKMVTTAEPHRGEEAEQGAAFFGRKRGRKK